MDAGIELFRDGKSSGLEFCNRKFGGCLADFFPNLIAASSCFRGEGNYLRCRIRLRETGKCVAQLIVGEAIAFSSDDKKIAARGIKEIQELAIAILRRNIDVDQRHAQSQCGALMEIRLDKLRPLLRDFAREFGVAVAREVGKDEFRLRLARPAHFKKIDAAGAPGSGAGAGYFGANQRVNHTGFADIRTAKKSNFRQAGSGEVSSIGSCRQKLGQDPHIQSLHWDGEIGKPDIN